MIEYWGDRSVTFRRQDSKENESWIMLIYSGLKNLIRKWVWCGGLSPHICALVVANGYGTCCFHLLSVMVDFMLLSDIYSFLFWVGWWYLLSTCSLYGPQLEFSSLLFCGVQKVYHRIQLALDSRQSPAHQSLGDLLILAYAGFSHSHLDVFEFCTWTILLLIFVS